MLAVLLACLLVEGASAGDWYVDDDAPGGDGTSWATAYATLQDALVHAHSGDNVRVAGGTYRPDQGGGSTLGDRAATFLVPGGCSVLGGYRGLAGGGDPDDRDTTLYLTVLSGDLAGDGPYGSDDSYHVVRATASGILLDGLIVEAGHASGPTQATRRGGGMMFVTAQVTVRDCTVRSCRARWGSGIHQSSGSVTIESSRIVSNRGPGAADSQGDGIYVTGGTLTLVDCEFDGNQADDLTSVGGSLHLVAGAVLAASGCTFSNAQANQAAALYSNDSDVALVGCTFRSLLSLGVGGAVTFRHGALSIAGCHFEDLRGDEGGGFATLDESVVHVSDSTFVACTAHQGGGGGISLTGAGSSLDLRDSSFTGNWALKGGGGLFGIGQVKVARCTFEDNISQTAGGGARLDTALEHVRVSDCVFRGNWTDGSGGGLAVSMYPQTRVTVVRTLLEDNEADHGGGLLAQSSDAEGTLRLRDCRVAGNTALVTGGGVKVEGAALDADGLALVGNACVEGAHAGGGLRLDASAGALRRATIAHNEVGTDDGAGIAVTTAVGPMRLFDSIVWENDALSFPGAFEDIDDLTGTLAVEYCTVRFGHAGLGNLSGDPQFQDPVAGDYALLPTSPCIDAGDPTSSYDPDGTLADQGAFPYLRLGLGRSYCIPDGPNSTGLPGRALAEGSLVVADDDLTIACDQLPPGERAALFSSTTRGGAVFLDGDGAALCIGAPFGWDVTTLTLVDGLGQAVFPVDLSGVPVARGTLLPAAPGDTFTFQVVFEDGAQRGTTNALELVFE